VAEGAPLRADAEIVANSAEGGTNRRITMAVGPSWPGSAPGQFVMVSPGARSAAPRFDPLLPRPMAVYRERGAGAARELEILYKVTGRGTQLLSEARPGDRLGLVGPLGRRFPEPPAGSRAVLVGGGTGIASLFELACRAAASAQVVALLGARTSEELMGCEDFRRLDADVRFATEDGSEGHPGRVTELLEELADAEVATTVYACGPTPMMRRAAEIAEGRGAGCWVSLENTMACGFGVCLGCAVARAEDGFALVCRDGPVFEAGAIDWQLLP
jgi:dihydroorotate dehydrogenase electron transfer subunit